MASGILFLVVGRSGVGKDALIEGARAALAGRPDFVFARRVITRPLAAGGEDHESVGPDEFARRKASGAFLFSWSAHGLEYGLPIALRNELLQGRHVVANGSRGTVSALAGLVPRVMAIEITADPKLVAARLKARGRESGEAMLERMTRTAAPIPAHVETIGIANDADLASGTKRFVAALTSAAAAATAEPRT